MFVEPVACRWGAAGGSIITQELESHQHLPCIRGVVSLSFLSLLYMVSTERLEGKRHVTLIHLRASPGKSRTASLNCFGIFFFNNVSYTINNDWMAGKRQQKDHISHHHCHSVYTETLQSFIDQNKPALHMLRVIDQFVPSRGLVPLGHIIGSVLKSQAAQ